MSDRNYAALFEHEGDQAVCLPSGYKLPGTEVRVSWVGRSILLEPIEQASVGLTNEDLPATPEDIRALFDEFDRMIEENGLFMPEGRQQPSMPSDDDIPSFE